MSPNSGSSDAMLMPLTDGAAMVVTMTVAMGHRWRQALYGSARRQAAPRACPGVLAQLCACTRVAARAWHLAAGGAAADALL
jgi:hypothetical protein